MPNNRETSPALIGRSAELDRIQQLTCAAAKGLGGAILVRGEAGMGKSALLDAVAGDHSDMRVLRITGRQTESGGSGWPVYALGLLDLVHGRHRQMVERMERVLNSPLRHKVVITYALTDYVEACARLGEGERAAPAVEQFEVWARAVAQPWAAAIVHRCAALLGPDELAESHYVAALAEHDRGGRRFERARTELLYGEWLRRARRRLDARIQLRSAMDTFSELGAKPWTGRARTELAATGDRADTVGHPTYPLRTLIPQERQLVRLAATGVSNRQIAARLFLSPKTVGFHLYKASPNLGVTSRGELTQILGQC